MSDVSPAQDRSRVSSLSASSSSVSSALSALDRSLRSLQAGKQAFAAFKEEVANALHSLQQHRVGMDDEGAGYGDASFQTGASRLLDRTSQFLPPSTPESAPPSTGTPHSPSTARSGVSTSRSLDLGQLDRSGRPAATRDIHRLPIPSTSAIAQMSPVRPSPALASLTSLAPLGSVAARDTQAPLDHMGPLPDTAVARLQASMPSLGASMRGRIDHPQHISEPFMQHSFDNSRNRAWPPLRTHATASATEIANNRTHRYQPSAPSASDATETPPRDEPARLLTTSGPRAGAAPVAGGTKVHTIRHAQMPAAQPEVRAHAELGGLRHIADGGTKPHEDRRPLVSRLMNIPVEVAKAPPPPKPAALAARSLSLDRSPTTYYAGGHDLVSQLNTAARLSPTTYNDAGANTGVVAGRLQLAAQHVSELSITPKRHLSTSGSTSTSSATSAPTRSPHGKLTYGELHQAQSVRPDHSHSATESKATEAKIDAPADSASQLHLLGAGHSCLLCDAHIDENPLKHYMEVMRLESELKLAKADAAAKIREAELQAELREQRLLATIQLSQPVAAAPSSVAGSGQGKEGSFASGDAAELQRNPEPAWKTASPIFSTEASVIGSHYVPKRPTRASKNANGGQRKARGKSASTSGKVDLSAEGIQDAMVRLQALTSVRDSLERMLRAYSHPVHT